nr:exodeoxyribonuclease VII small subunit [Solimonas flava]
MPAKNPVPPPAPAPSADPVGQFEEAMKELESIVQTLERGDLRLDESLRLFERGVALARQCRGSLEHAELKVHDLLASDRGGDDDADEDAGP